MRFFLIIGFVFYSFQLLSNHKADSLRTILKTYESKSNFESDTAYINNLLHFYGVLEFVDSDSARILGEKALELSREHHYTEGKINALLKMGNTQLTGNNASESIRFFEEALAEKEKTGDKEQLSTIYISLGIAQSMRGDRIKALEMFHTSADYAKQCVDTLFRDRNVSRVLCNMGKIYLELGELQTALDHFFEAVILGKNSGQLSSVSAALNSIFVIYLQQERYAEALEKSNEAIEVAKQENNPNRLAPVYLGKASLCTQIHEYDEAIALYDEVIKISRGVGNKLWETEALWGMSFIYNTLGNSYKSIILLSEAREICRYFEDKRPYASCLVHLARAYLEQKDFSKAVNLCREALEIGEIENLLFVKRGAHETLSKAYEKQNKGMPALEHYKKYKALSDSIFNDDLRTKTANFEVKYEYQQKELELKAEQTLKETEFSRQKARLELILVSAVIILVMVIIILLVMTRSRNKLQQAYRELGKANKEIHAQKEEISMQTKELQAANEKLVELVKFKQDISGMIVHDLKNPLSVILHLTKTIPDSRGLELLHESAQRMFRLVMNILDINKYEDSKLEVNYEEHDFCTLIKDVTQDSELETKFKEISFSTHCEENLSFRFDRDIIRRVMNNIVNNAVRFSPRGETIGITAVRENELVVVSITNNGPAISEEMQNVIFELYKTGNSEENSNTAYSTGLGLAFCKMAVTAHGGTIGCSGNSESSTCFWFKLPYQGRI